MTLPVQRPFRNLGASWPDTLITPLSSMQLPGLSSKAGIKVERRFRTPVFKSRLINMGIRFILRL